MLVAFKKSVSSVGFSELLIVEAGEEDGEGKMILRSVLANRVCKGDPGTGTAFFGGYNEFNVSQA